MKRFATGIASALAVACGAAGGGGGAGDGGGGGGGGGGSGGLCSATNKCPAGQFCYNGICAYGCNSNGDCAADQYCDTGQFGSRLCHNKTVTTCPETPCASSQICVKGACSTPPPPTQCDPDRVVDGQDGCDKQSICLDADGNDQPKCYSFSACPQDSNCPIGTVGSVCNDGIIPNKSRICLTGLCRSVSNCPSSWKCVKTTTNAVVGICSSGGPYAPCAASSDCQSGNCFTQPGFIGFCS